MPEEDYDELYHLTDNPEFSGLDPHHVPSTISEEESPGIYLTNDPHSHVGTNLDKPYIATFRVPVGYEDHPAFEPDHYGKSGDYFVSPEWYDHIQFAGISPNPAHKKGGSDRTAAVHDRLMQILAMADTTPWHPLITPKDGFYPKYQVHSPEGRKLGELEYEKYLPDPVGKIVIHKIVVHPEHQGKGIGQALVERLHNDHPEYKIDPGLTTIQGSGFTERLRKIIPDAEEKLVPKYKPATMSQGGSDFWTRGQMEGLVGPGQLVNAANGLRRLSFHDRVLQICAMADTTPWHPFIESDEQPDSRHGRGRDKSYFIGNPDPGRITDRPIAQLDVTLHNKGDKHWRNSEPGRPSGFYLREHNEAYINSIIVHPEFQGQGIAQALIERLNSDHPEYRINPGVTTPKGFGLVQQLKKLIPDSEAKMSPNYKPYVMDDGESAEYEKSEYASVGHEDYEYDDYTSEYNPRKLVNASYDDGPYWGAAWDDEDDDDEDDWPEGTPKRKRKHGNDLANAPHYVGYDEPPYVGKHRKEEEPSRLRKWLRSWHPDEIALPAPKNKRTKEPVTARFWHAGKSGELPEEIKFSHGKMFDGRDAVQAHIGDKLVGQLQWDSGSSKRGFDNDINYITVHPEYRRRGIGSAMYQHVVQNIDPHLLPGSLDVTPSGKGLSKSLGFRPKDQGTYYDGTPMKFNLSPVRDDGNDWPDAAVGNGWQWDEKFNRRSKDRFSRFWTGS